jgi:hypothetical protein
MLQFPDTASTAAPAAVALEEVPPVCALFALAEVLPSELRMSVLSLLDLACDATVDAADTSGSSSSTSSSTTTSNSSAAAGSKSPRPALKASSSATGTTDAVSDGKATASGDTADAASDEVVVVPAKASKSSKKDKGNVVQPVFSELVRT